MYKLALVMVDNKIVKINQIGLGFTICNLEGEEINPLFFVYEEGVGL